MVYLVNERQSRVSSPLATVKDRRAPCSVLKQSLVFSHRRGKKWRLSTPWTSSVWITPVCPSSWPNAWLIVALKILGNERGKNSGDWILCHKKDWRSTAGGSCLKSSCWEELVNSSPREEFPGKCGAGCGDCRQELGTAGMEDVVKLTNETTSHRKCVGLRPEFSAWCHW